MYTIYRRWYRVYNDMLCILFTGDGIEFIMTCILFTGDGIEFIMTCYVYYLQEMV